MCCIHNNFHRNCTIDIKTTECFTVNYVLLYLGVSCLGMVTIPKHVGAK